MSKFWAWSLGLHAVLLALILLRPTPPAPVAPTVVEVEFTGPDELTPAPARPREKTKRAPKVTPRQIVEQTHQLNDEIDHDTRFLSAFNQKVLRQTRAERTGAYTNEVHGGTAGEAKTPTTTKSETKPALKTAVRRPPGELPSLADLLPKYEARRYAPGAAGADQNRPADPPGDPTRTDDYLKDVRPGLQTMISTREFVYYAYYNRIKAALRSQWEPEVRERVGIVLRQGRAVAEAKDRVTQVVVTLDERGELVAVDVITASGLNDLDDAAVQAFRRAAPFPNPPRGMVDGDGRVKIRWDFVLEV